MQFLKATLEASARYVDLPEPLAGDEAGEEDDEQKCEGGDEPHVVVAAEYDGRLRWTRWHLPIFISRSSRTCV